MRFIRPDLSWFQSYLGIYFLALFLTAHGYAQGFENLRFNGFMRTQVTATDNKVVYRERNTHTANFVNYNALGLNMAAEVDPFWRVNAQFLSSGEQFHFGTVADWYFTTFEPQDWFSMRFGKQISPLWLLSDSVDIGVTYPWVNPPTEVYNITPVKTYSGVSMNLKSEIMPDNYLSLEIYGGGVDNSFDNPEFSEPIVVKADNLLGAYVLLANDWMSLRFGYLQTRINVPVYEIDKWPVEAMSAGTTLDLGGFVLFSEYAKIAEKRSDQRRTEDSAEYAEQISGLEQQITGEILAGGQPTPEELAQMTSLQGAYLLQSQQALGHEAYYVTIGYKLKNLLPHYTYASVKAPESQLIVGGDQTSHMIGVKYSVTPQIVAKLSAQKIQIKEGKLGAFSRNSDGSIPDDIDGAVEVKAALDITF